MKGPGVKHGSEGEQYEMEVTCVSCPRGCQIGIICRGDTYEFENAGCQRGEEYARAEVENPTRILCTTVRVDGGELPLVPVKTEEPIPRDLMFAAMRELALCEIKAPIRGGDVVLKDLLDTGIGVLATRTVGGGE